MKKRLLPFMALCALLLTFLGARPAEASTVNIVFDSAYAPFEFQEADGSYQGIDVDIINEVAKRANWKVKASYPGFDAALNAVQAGQADAIMAGMTITDERKEIFDFSDPYFDTTIVIATTKKQKISDYKQLKGKKVGVKTGTVSQKFLAENEATYGYTIKTFDSGDKMYNSLFSSSVDAIMDDTAVIQYAESQGKDLAIHIEAENIGSFGFAVKKGGEHQQLLEDFNKALADMKADGSYDQIIRKWTGSSPQSQTEGTGDADAKAKPVKDLYIISSDSSFAPFEYQNDKGQFVGIDMELIQAIADQQGFTIQIQNPGFQAALNDVQAGQADAIIAGMSITEERQEIFDFSDSYYTSNILLAVKTGSPVKSYKDLKGKLVAAKMGTSSYRFLEEHKDQYGYRLKSFDDATKMYDSLGSGSVDAIMDDEAVLLYSIQQGRQFETPVAGEPSGQYGFAVKKGSNPELIEMFNNGLAALKSSGQYDKIITKYLEVKKPTTDETTIVGLLANNWQRLLKGLGVTLSLALISFACALVIGIFFGMMAVSPFKLLRTISAGFVDIIRGIPLMIVVAFIFWGVPNLIENLTGVQSPINDFLAGVIALSLNSGAYIAEIVRGGIEAVPKGQTEASRSLGIPYGKTMRSIILPQAGRIMLPNFINQFVITLKDTTIITAIGLTELFRTGDDIIARNFQSFRMYAILAVIYLIIITLLTKLAKNLEKRSH